MEVHHHAHTERKKWNHYLWEFIMLFLAVFCGFLAENLREHIVEHKRARVYAEGLLNDLKNDTADINEAARFETMAALMIDSLSELVSHDKSTYKSGLLYYYMRLGSSNYTIDWNKATINQLINSGNLRYFSNQQLVTKISSYNTTSNMIRDLEESIDQNRNRALAYRDQIASASVMQFFNSASMDSLLRRDRTAFADSIRNSEFVIANNDPGLLNSMVNALITTKSLRKVLMVRIYPKAINEAVAIMDMLRKDYKLK